MGSGMLWLGSTGGSLMKTRNVYMLLFFVQIPKLTEGREYIMRISAENMYGISDPLESEEMRAKDLFSTFFANLQKRYIFQVSFLLNFRKFIFLINKILSTVFSTVLNSHWKNNV